MYQEYLVWRQQASHSQWLPTSHVVKARSELEAQSRMVQKFKNAGFSSMSLVAVLNGVDPNLKAQQ